jgi:hypothetical protein
MANNLELIPIPAVHTAPISQTPVEETPLIGETPTSQTSVDESAAS